MSSQNEGIPEVPSDIPVHHRAFWQAMRNHVIKQRAGSQAPVEPTNFAVTPVSGGNVIQFTRPVDADNCVVFSSNTSDLGSAALLANLGLSTTYTDNLGKGGVTKFYWVRAYKGTLQGGITSPTSGTSLNLNTNATIPVAPPNSDATVFDSTTGRDGPSIERSGRTETV